MLVKPASRFGLLSTFARFLGRACIHAGKPRAPRPTGLVIAGQVAKQGAKAGIKALAAGAARTSVTAAQKTASSASRFVVSNRTGGSVIDTASEATQAQVQRVVTSIRTTGKPPEGARQGTAPGGPVGVFRNNQEKLPKKPEGYYTESDVWPGPGPRGSERVVVGQGGEAWYGPDHYGTFRELL